MQDFIFLFRGGASARAALSPEQMQQHLKKWTSWFEGLGKNGHYHGVGHPLDRAGKVLRGTKKILTDGPFAESKDVVGGFAVINAATIDRRPRSLAAARSSRTTASSKSDPCKK
jgi:hypothetical protein